LRAVYELSLCATGVRFHNGFNCSDELVKSLVAVPSFQSFVCGAESFEQPVSVSLQKDVNGIGEPVGRHEVLLREARRYRVTEPSVTSGVVDLPDLCGLDRVLV
jgi:hypothetical protein